MEEERKGLMMTSWTCGNCGTGLIWGGDHDIDYPFDECSFMIVSNYTCPGCNAYVEVST